jgi:hypothetical protein
MFLASLQHIETMPHQQLQNNSTRVGAIVRIANQFNNNYRNEQYFNKI